MLCNTQERNNQLWQIFVVENVVPSALSLDIFICISCQAVTMCTYININVQPQVRRAAELWLLPQVSEDPGPCPSESTILNGSPPWKDFLLITNQTHYLSKFIVIKLYMFRASSLPIIRILYCTYGTGNFHAGVDDRFQTELG